MNEKVVKSSVSEDNFYNIFQILYFSITKVREKHDKNNNFPLMGN